MYLTRHGTSHGARWALDGRYLPPSFDLTLLLELPADAVAKFLEGMSLAEEAEGALLAPVEPGQEVWASGVTYERSREARLAESHERDDYDKVYDAERPELFFKAIGWRVVGHGEKARIRKDSYWNVPEPELTLVLNNRMEIVGYTAGNDMSSRDIEGENSLYLPQAKIYDGSCAVGPGITLIEGPELLRDLTIKMVIWRGGNVVFEGEIGTSKMKRLSEELASYLGKELVFPNGAFLMTGTGIVPEERFTLEAGDVVEVSVGDLILENEVAQ